MHDDGTADQHRALNEQVPIHGNITGLHYTSKLGLGASSSDIEIPKEAQRGLHRQGCRDRYRKFRNHLKEKHSNLQKCGPDLPKETWKAQSQMPKP